MERLQKVIANRGYCSRRKAEQLIEQGMVMVDGKLVTELGVKVAPNATIEVEGILLEKPELVYYLVNKPRGYISTVDDEYNRKNVVDLIAPSSVNERIFPVGRLDKDTTGLLILTNDGEFMNTMTHPKYHIPKTYQARLKGVVTTEDLRKLLHGVFIEHGVKVKADEYEVLERNKRELYSVVNLVIHDGKYHQVKRMFQVIGYPVKKLKRIKYGHLELKNMPVGTYRKLKKPEIMQLLNFANAGQVVKK